MLKSIIKSTSYTPPRDSDPAPFRLSPRRALRAWLRRLPTGACRPRLPVAATPRARRTAAVLALVAVAAALVPVPSAQAQTTQTVPADWSLIPKDASNNPLFTAGQSFRLLFVTSTTTAATSTSIATYNTFVQTRAAANTAISGVTGLSAKFRAVGSTVSTDARDNTATTGTGVPIYWLGGAKVADNYADFYDGTWDSNVPRNEAGSTISGNVLVWTGSTQSGTEYVPSGTSRALGTSRVAAGQPTSQVTGVNFLSVVSTSSQSNPLYALSPVITVRTPTTTPTPGGSRRPPADPGISTDARLDKLVIRAGDGAPVPFSPALRARRDAPAERIAVVPFDVTQVTVAPTASHSRHRRITVNGERVASGRASDAIALEPGIPAVITVTVTAEDDKTTRTYTFIVARARAAGAPTGVTLAPDLVRPAATDDPATEDSDERIAQYRISLPWQPLGEVTVTPVGSAPGIAAVSGPLRFTPDNWDTPQPVTVTGRANGRAGIAHRIAGGGYDGAVVPEATVIVGDGGADPRKQVKPCAACHGNDTAEADEAGPPPADTNDTASQAGADGPDGQDALHAPPRAPAGALAALARGHLSGARQVLAQRLDADADAPSYLTLGGHTLTLAQLLRPDWGGAALDPDRPPAETGLSWARATGACASRTAAACDWTDTPGLSPPHDNRPAGAWESLLYGIASGLGQGAAGSLLQGSGFTLTLGPGEPAGQAAPGRRWTLWGRTDTQTLAGLPAAWAGTDTALRSGYLGLDTRVGDNWLAGLALSRSRGPGGGAAGHAGLTGDGLPSVPYARLRTAPAALTTVHPYLAWSGNTASVSVQAGLGRGRDGYQLTPGAVPGLTPDAVPLRLTMALADADRQLAARGGATLRLRTDAAWAQLTRGTGPRAQTESVRRLRAGAEAAWTGELPGGWTLAPRGAAHWRHDAGHGPTGRGLELTGALRAARGPLRLTVEGRRFTTRTAEASREQGVAATLDLGQPGTAGWSLSLAARWGEAASGGTALWQEQVRYRHGAPHATPRTLSARSEVGLRLPGGRLLTWFADAGHAGHGHHVLLGLRLGAGAHRPDPAPHGAQPLTEETPHGNE